MIFRIKKKKMLSYAKYVFLKKSSLVQLDYLTFETTLKYKQKNSNNLIIFPAILQSLDVKVVAKQCKISRRAFKNQIYFISNRIYCNLPMLSRRIVHIAFVLVRNFFLMFFSSEDSTYSKRLCKMWIL